MKLNFWSIVGIALAAVTIIFWIIPAFLEWQKHQQNHEEKMLEKTIELERLMSNSRPQKGITGILKGFFSRSITEIGPTIAGKMIGGI
ncbi:MAG: hypothetical protein M9954_13390 [Cyclobacteriaceae bacterium]|nr:hypothetical protein [Cyclobacteriaceae bacterium]